MPDKEMNRKYSSVLTAVLESRTEAVNHTIGILQRQMGGVTETEHGCHLTDSRSRDFANS